MAEPSSRLTPRTRRGLFAQQAARRSLEAAGYRVIEENYRCRFGELDIVAIDGDCLVIVEVRSKSTSAFGTPEESISPVKARRLRFLVDAYRADRIDTPLPINSRIDVVAVDLTRRGIVDDLRIVRNAVEG
ncbi:MAG: YraN family protein [Chloroflexi bacterium]|nr:YraN family protein [Chloroflexota bacterium]